MTTTPDCPRTTLVEALRDGRLGPQESASMERHLEGCSACAELARDLAKIGDAVRAPLERSTPLEHQRARVALLQKAAMHSPVHSLSNAKRFGFGAVLAAAAVVLGFVGGQWNNQTNQVAIALHLGALPPVTLGSKLGLHPSDDARFTRNRKADVDELTLEHGTIDVHLPKLEGGKRFIVKTTDAQIEVRATAFRVEAENGKIRSVAVEQGTVEVQYAGFTAVIPAGGSWRATAESIEPAKPTPKTENDASAPVENATNTPVRVAVNGSTASKPAPRPVLAKDPIDVMDPPDKPAPEPTPVVVEPAPPAPPPTPARATPSPASKTFAEAMAAMRRGDYAVGAKKLEQFAQTHAADARADEADYLRAIALQRAGRRDEAVAAAKRYLATRPNGAHRADAARIAGK
jgi:ferric-dicitrate binding protein FerR (iron transport regulator)